MLGAKANLVYAKGNNLGANFLLRHFDIDYFLFTNNDLRIVDVDVVEKLIDLRSERRYWCYWSQNGSPGWTGSEPWKVFKYLEAIYYSMDFLSSEKSMKQKTTVTAFELPR